MNRSAHLTLWLVILSCGVCTAQSNQYDPAPLLRHLAAASTDTARIRLLTALGDFYLEKSGAEPSDMDSALLLLRKARTLCIRTGNQRGAELADYYIGWTLVDAQDHIGLLRLFPTLSDSTRIHVLLRAVDDLLNPPDRTQGRMDTVHLFIRQVLALNKNSSLVNQLQVLVKCAVIDYCNRHLYVSGPPSPAWLTDDPTDLNPLFDWMTIQLWQDAALITDLQALRARWNKESDRVEHDTLLRTIRSTMVYVLSDEAQNNAYNHRNDPAEKEFMLALALDSTGASPNIDLYGTISRWYLDQGAAQKALRYALQAVRHIEDHRSATDLAAITRAYLSTGIIYYDLHNPNLALTYLQKAVAIVHEAGLQPDARLLKTITDCYLALSQPHIALAFLHTAINSSLWQDGVYKEQVSESIGECYFALGRFDDAERWYLKSWEVAQHRGHQQQMQSSFYLGKLYTRTGQYGKARTWLTPIAADSGKALMPISMFQDTHYLLFQLDSATGNYISAIHHLQVFRTLKDSIFDDTRNQQIEELTLRYATEKKDRDLQRLKDQALLQQATLRQNNILRNAFGACAVLLILLLALVLSRYRTRQRSNRLLQIRQKEIDDSNCRLHQLNVRQQRLLEEKEGLLVEKEGLLVEKEGLLEEKVRLLEEKEWLMREVHHRVRNNLQLIISLLKMQTAHLRDELALSAFGDISTRIYTISLIHQQLYQDQGDMTMINMPDYVSGLVGFLDESRGTGQRIRFRLEVAPIRLDVSQSVPVGLILNEAISNAIKYAFPGDYIDPCITVTLRQDEDRTIHLTVSDNGVGLPAEVDLEHSSSMGLPLIRTLAIQLEGKITVSRRPGTTIDLTFGRE